MPSQRTFLMTIMRRHKGAHEAVLERGWHVSLTFEIVNPFAIQDSDPVLEPRFTTAEKIYDIPYLLRCILLLLGGRHGPWRICYTTEINARPPAYVARKVLTEDAYKI
jgi:hypothetical protein